MLERLSLIAYRLLWFILLPLLLIVLVIRSRNHPEYRQRLGERLGLNAQKLKQTDIVLHAASVGEVLALKPLVHKLLTDNPDLSITFTCFTPTGSAQIQKLFGDSVQHCYLPLDNWLSTRAFLNAVNPRLFVFMETEIWPSLLHQCSKRNINTMIVNGRLSKKSLPKYKKLNKLITPCLNLMSDIYCQSKENQENFQSLAVASEKCSNVGNLKFDIKINEQIVQKQQELGPLIDQNRALVLLASSHEGDESRFIEHYTRLKKDFPNLLYGIVPRHPERFEAVAELCQNKGLQVVKRSAGVVIQPSDDVWLVDTLGELLAVSSFADFVVMGGSFSNIGGHNPLEPALFQKPVIVGPDMNNFTEIMEQLEQAQAVLKTAGEVSALGDAMHNLLSDKQQVTTLGENAYSVVQNNQGATEKTRQRMLELLR